MAGDEEMTNNDRDVVENSDDRNKNETGDDKNKKVNNDAVAESSLLPAEVEPAAKKQKVMASSTSGENNNGNYIALPPTTTVMKKKKKTHKRNVPPEVFAYRRAISMCCRNDDLHTAMEIYYTDAKSKSLKMEHQTFHNLISLCDGFKERAKVHIGSPRPEKPRHTNAKKNGKKKMGKKSSIYGPQETADDDDTGNNTVHDNGQAASDSHTISTNNKKAEKCVDDANVGNATNNDDKLVNKDPASTNNTESGNTETTKDHVTVNENNTETPDDNEIANDTKVDSSNDVDASTKLEPQPVTVQEVSLAKRREYANLLRTDMESMSVPLNETSYTALVRLLSKAGEVEEASAVLTEAEKNFDKMIPKLRLYSSLLLAYGDRQDMSGVLKTWERACNTANLELSEKEYCAAIKCATLVRDAGVMDRALAELADIVLVPSRETTQAIVKWFESEYANGDRSSTINESLLSTVSLCPTPAPSMGPITNATKSPFTISPLCSIDTVTGILSTGCLKDRRLKPVQLSPTAERDLMRMNETIVMDGTLKGHSSKFQGGRKGVKRHLTTQKSDNMLKRRAGEWKAFTRWLYAKVGPPSQPYEEGCSDEEESSETTSCTTIQPFDVVIDGANVGYYKTNFAGSPKHVDYRQIDQVIRHFTKDNKKVLVVLHERHFHPNLLPHWALPIVQSWDDVLYRAPGGSNDDWFWFHAALWCNESLVITNDEMRDHHFQMLAPGSFLRWKERHQVHFHLERDSREVVFEYPDVYSRRIQRLEEGGLVIPLPKRGDTKRFLDGVFDADDNEAMEETYMCIGTS